MTREQEIIAMGAHAARPTEHRPTTAARLATTTLAVAVTGVLGAGTALAHDGDGHGGHDGHTSQSVDEARDQAHDQARTEAARARAEAHRTVQAVLADLGLDTADTATADTDDAPTDGSSEDHGGDHAAASASPSAQPSPPPSEPRTTTQPIRSAPGDRSASDVPPPGESETIPIR